MMALPEILKELKHEINSDNPLPVSLQVARKLENGIKSGLIEPGQKLPGDAQLSKMLAVEYRTARKAFALLEEKELIRRVKKSGTFVRDNIYTDTPNIGLFYFQETETRMLEYADVLQQFLSGKNFDLKIYGFDRHYFDRTDFLRDVKQSNLSGAIIYSVPEASCLRALQSLEENNFPYVQFASYNFINELKAPTVRGNVAMRINDAINYLWEKGHRRIGLVYDYKGNETELEYTRFFRENGNFDKRRMMNVQFSGNLEEWRKFPGTQLARGYLADNPDITALIVENVPVCIDYLRQAPLAGKTIPQELSLLCLHDWEAFDVVSPPVTAMTIFSDTNRRAMAEAAGEKLLAIIDGGYPDRKEIIEIEHQFVERESISAINQT